jgi:hypothetical protein
MLPCREGTVAFVGPRLGGPHFSHQDFVSTGVGVEISVRGGFEFFPGVKLPDARVVHYQGEAGNAIMERQRAGDRVQVCAAGFPLPSSDPKTGTVICDPDRDPRGFVFRVYNYRLRAAYMGPNSQHQCGGA